MDMDIGRGIDMDRGMDMESLQCSSSYTVVWITCDISRRTSRTNCTIHVWCPFLMEKLHMQIFRSTYRLQDCQPNDVLGELEIRVWGQKKATNIGTYNNLKLTSHIPYLAGGVSHERGQTKSQKSQLFSLSVRETYQLMPLSDKYISVDSTFKMLGLSWRNFLKNLISRLKNGSQSLISDLQQIHTCSTLKFNILKY